MYVLDIPGLSVLRCVCCYFVALCCQVVVKYIKREIGDLENAGLGLAYAAVFLTINPIAFGIIIKFS